MRALLLLFCLCIGLAPAAAAAQVPSRSVTFDAASAFEQRYRAAVEAAVLGRFTVGLGASYTRDASQGTLIVPPSPCLPDIACPQAFLEGSVYQAWSVDLSARWYPRALSWARGAQSANLYLGEFIGYHQRSLSTPVIISCPITMLCTDPANAVVSRMRGVEPGAEIGVRLKPTRHFVLDVGGRFRLATFDDQFTQTMSGDVDAKFVIGLGLGW